jgi:hypothetical protein
MPIRQAQYYGNAVTIDGDASANLTWDHFATGDDTLIDTTDPANPVVTVTGLYLVSAQGQGSDGPVAAIWALYLLQSGVQTGAGVAPAQAATNCGAGASGAWQMTAGDVINVGASNGDQVNPSDDFQLAGVTVVCIPSS